MESRLKERLTGAAILVALVVLLVPEMFRGQRGEVAAPTSGGEGPPVRSYTIDLSNSPTSSAPLQSTPAPPPASGSEPASTPAAANPATGKGAAPATPSPPPPAPAVAAGRIARPPASPASGASTQHGASGGWSVQLGIFAQHDNAERMLHSAQTKGFSASVSDKDAKGLYHVQIGNLADRTAAQAMQGRLREQGFAAAVVSPH
ncbi:MAG TPA: SPOR domain-containing protein [Steroidobacteraceae bacterium]|jgi:DedD protein